MRHLGVGVDIEIIQRFRNLNRKKDKRFFDLVYTSKELEFCYNSINVAQQLAKYFCGKESVIKALNGIGYSRIYAYNIEISCSSLGNYKVQIQNNPRSLFLCLSISHCEEQAIAFSIASENTIN